MAVYYIATDGVDDASPTRGVSPSTPYASVGYATVTRGGSNTYICAAGIYGPQVIAEEASGTAARPTILASATLHGAVFSTYGGHAKTPEQERVLNSDGLLLGNRTAGAGSTLEWVTVDGIECSYNDQHGIVFYGTNVHIKNCKCHHNGMVDNQLPLSNASGSGIGSFTAYWTGVIVEDCEIYTNGQTGLDHGTYLYVSGAIVRRNLVYDHFGVGIQTMGAAATDSNIVVTSNKDATTGAIRHTIYDNAVDTYSATNNLIYGSAAGIIIIAASSGGNLVAVCPVVNNIIADVSGLVFGKGGLQTSANFLIDYNLLDHLDVAYGELGGAWYGANNVVGDPVFTDAAGGDYTPTVDSPVVAEGSLAYRAYYDFDGEPRTDSPPDIGPLAYELQADAAPGDSLDTFRIFGKVDGAIDCLDAAFFMGLPFAAPYGSPQNTSFRIFGKVDGSLDYFDTSFFSVLPFAAHYGIPSPGVRMVAGQVFCAGATCGQVFTAGASAGQVFVAGATCGEVVRS